MHTFLLCSSRAIIERLRSGSFNLDIFVFYSPFPPNRKPAKRLRFEKEGQRRKRAPLKTGLLAGGASAPQIAFALQKQLRRGGSTDPEHFKAEGWSDRRERNPTRKATTLKVLIRDMQKTNF